MAQKIANGYANDVADAIILSTDNYFMKDGKYCFDPKMLGQYHMQTQWNVRDAMNKGVACVILDNTNLKAEFIKPYIELAKTYGL